MPSVTFWIVLGCWVSVSAALYIRVLFVIKTAKNAMYDTFFFRQFFSQGLFDMTFFAVYIVFNTLPPSANLSLNGTILIRIQYLHTYYFLYAQFCEELPQILVFFIQLVVPFFLIVHCLFQLEPYYILQNENAVRVIAPESVLVNAAQAAVTTSLACSVCAVSYALLLRKLRAYSKSIKTQSRRYLHRETALSLMGFTLFIALCVVTAFYIAILVGILLNPTTYRFITSYYPHIIAVISFMNPWALIMTDSSTRKRAFRISVQNAMAYTTSVF
ncbi:hypothetical protein PRIPAC_78439 [Pristionchus pacificus]|uniref:G protein-coupled receptor n=1 Tax=Pristionchus pacificus TaxID=54126 RepID=A0A2A6CM43_PRIPA|nr:hypothetical protein PRIPAC_78439 [Pristionchus pacificus]|eukprot:PDM79168.1 G protein-coupled receptor [Pristionchus pacificus]